MRNYEIKQVEEEILVQKKKEKKKRKKRRKSFKKLKLISTSGRTPQSQRIELII